MKYLKNIKIKKKPKKKKFEINFIGRLNKIKNIELQIELIHNLIKRQKNYKLNIIGPDDGSLINLKKKVTQLKLEKYVFFFNPIYGKRKYSLIKNSDIVILTSLYECNSILAIETMSLGGVLLCTTNCNLMEAGKYGAVKVSDYKLQNLTESVDYLREKKNSDLIRKKALKYAQKNLDIEINIKNILKFYKKINW